jgi:formamidopyrimidine-DNA glycosylase
VPELPEVETVRRRLDPQVVGRRVTDVCILDQTVSRQSQAEMRALLLGKVVRAIGRRGKWLLFDLGDVTMVVHLRMTGRLMFQPDAESAGRRPRFHISLDDRQRLYFYDTRRFGRLWALPSVDLPAFFADLGAEPLEDGFTVRHLRDSLAGRAAPLKSFLTDQRRLAGVGNIYADEALFRARLHPLRAAGGVGPREAQRLHAAVIETLRLGIEHEGSSVESFVDPAGERGRFQEILNVYQRTGEPCRVCGTPIQRIVVGGRGTHFCPRCQPRRAAKRYAGR